MPSDAAFLFIHACSSAFPPRSPFCHRPYTQKFFFFFFGRFTPGHKRAALFSSLGYKSPLCWVPVGPGCVEEAFPPLSLLGHIHMADVPPVADCVQLFFFFLVTDLFFFFFPFSFLPCDSDDQFPSQIEVDGGILLFFGPLMRLFFFLSSVGSCLGGLSTDGRGPLSFRERIFSPVLNTFIAHFFSPFSPPRKMFSFPLPNSNATPPFFGGLPGPPFPSIDPGATPGRGFLPPRVFCHKQVFFLFPSQQKGFSLLSSPPAMSDDFSNCDGVLGSPPPSFSLSCCCFPLLLRDLWPLFSPPQKLRTRLSFFFLSKGEQSPSLLALCGVNLAFGLFFFRLQKPLFFRPGSMGLELPTPGALPPFLHHFFCFEIVSLFFSTHENLPGPRSLS